MKLFGEIIGPVFKYPNTIWGAKKKNTENRILFGIEIIRIQNTNTIQWSNLSNIMLIPNYSSHPVSLPHSTSWYLLVPIKTSMYVSVPLYASQYLLVPLSTPVYILVLLGTSHTSFTFCTSCTSHTSHTSRTSYTSGPSVFWLRPQAST